MAVAALLGGGYAAMNWSAWKASGAVRELRAAATDEARTAAAVKLVALGETGTPAVIDVLKSSDAAGCAAVVAALRELPATEPAFAARFRALLPHADSFSDAGKDALLDVVPDLLKCPDAEVSGHAAAVVKGGLSAASPDAKVHAVALASLPEINLKAEVVPLLNDPQPQVRGAAMAAVGPACAPVVIGDEELFHWLNDADLIVQARCESALLTRGMDGDQIAAARRLAHPDAAERLKLLVDLRYGRDGLRDPGPWLERLSRDADPAVRAGAARTAVECRLTFLGWLDKLCTDDPDGTVRQVAGLKAEVF